MLALGLPQWLRGKESTCHAGHMGSILGSERSPGGGNGYVLQYSYLNNLKDRGAWRVTVHGVANSPVRLSTAQHSKRSWPSFSLAEL